MSGPGVYVPDVTEGITRVEDLPQPRIKLRSRNFSAGAALSVGGAVAAGVWPPAPFMISATPSAADRSTCIIEDDMPYRMASWHLWRDHRVFVPWATIQNWVEAAGEKKPGRR